MTVMPPKGWESNSASALAPSVKPTSRVISDAGFSLPLATSANISG